MRDQVADKVRAGLSSNALSKLSQVERTRLNPASSAGAVPIET